MVTRGRWVGGGRAGDGDGGSPVRTRATLAVLNDCITSRSQPYTVRSLHWNLSTSETKTEKCLEVHYGQALCPGQLSQPVAGPRHGLGWPQVWAHCASGQSRSRALWPGWGVREETASRPGGRLWRGTRNRSPQEAPRRRVLRKAELRGVWIPSIVFSLTHRKAPCTVRVSTQLLAAGADPVARRLLQAALQALFLSPTDRQGLPVIQAPMRVC